MTFPTKIVKLINNLSSPARQLFTNLCFKPDQLRACPLGIPWWHYWRSRRRGRNLRRGGSSCRPSRTRSWKGEKLFQIWKIYKNFWDTVKIFFFIKLHSIGVGCRIRGPFLIEEQESYNQIFTPLFILLFAMFFCVICGGLLGQ